MDAIITPSTPHGKISAIASKSVAHRLLICSAFAEQPTVIRCENTNNDILATAECLNAFGADISYNNGYFTVNPREKALDNGILNCGESGSTLRFLLPVAAALGSHWTFLMSGRLPERPLSPLYEELIAHGISLDRPTKDTLSLSGKLECGHYTISGEVSSQFISGLLFALSILDGESTLEVTGKVESAPYIKMTLDALWAFGAKIKEHDNVFTIVGKNLVGGAELLVEGDWSNAAFPLCAAALGGCVTVDKLNLNSYQGDMAILSVLEKFGAKVTRGENSVTVCSADLQAIELDATQIPDLVPVIAAVAASAKGTTRIYGASRLRIKESDRLMAIYTMLSTLGADITETDDGLIINGVQSLLGGTVSSFNDHRIAMSAAVASVISSQKVTVTDASAVNKSYPDFWRAFSSLGIDITLKD